MQPNHKRRTVLKAAGGLVAGAALPVLGTRRAAAAAGDLERLRLGENLTLITGAGSHVVVLEGPEGLALVDSGAPEQADALLRFIDAELGGLPVRTLFTTHWHLGHTGAHEAIGRAGARIVAHENTRLWMATEYYVEWEKRNYTPRPAAALPTMTFHASDPQPLVTEHGGQRIEYGHLAEAHTDGDIYVRFVDDNVIAAGDTLWVDEFPILDYSTGGWIGGLQDATRKLLELSDSSTRIVPGTGPLQTREALEKQLEMLDEMRERIRTRIIQGKSVEEILAENVGEGYEHLGDPGLFVANVYDGLWWGGRLRGAY